MSKVTSIEDIETSISLQEDNTSPQTGFTIRQLIKGRKDKHIERLARALRVTIKASRSDEPVITIKGEKGSVDKALETIQNLRQTAKEIVSREKLATKSQITIKHEDEVAQKLNSLLPRNLEKASVSVSRESALNTFNTAAPAGQKINREGKMKIVPFVPRNRSQALSYLALNDPKISYTYLVGPAGGGKSYTPMQVGFERWMKGEFDQILLIRPATTIGGRDPGAPPGDPKKKQSYFFEALDTNAIQITGMTLTQLDQKGIVRWATPDYLRGRTILRSFVIIEEAQSLSIDVAKAVEGRIGEGSLFVFNGDISGDQSDLNNQMPGLVYLISQHGFSIQEDEELNRGIAFIRFKESDSSARHPLLPHVQRSHRNPKNPFNKVMDSYRATAPNPARALAIQQGYEYARDILLNAASLTENRYVNQLKKKFPDFANASNVAAFSRMGL